MEFGRSLGAFVLGILRRFWVWVPALLLDPYDLWARVIKPMLPTEHSFDLPWSVDWAPFILALLIFWAAFLTYREIWRQAVREPRPNMRFAEIVSRIVGTQNYWSGNNPNHVAEALRIIREKARLGLIDVWARERTANADWQEKEPLRPIHRDYWQNYQFDYLDFLRDPKGQTELAKSTSRGEIFKDFYFDRDQIRREIYRPSLWARLQRMKMPWRAANT